MVRFLAGFAIGAAIGVASVVLTTRRSGSSLRHNVSLTVQNTLDAARAAQAEHEREMWTAYRARLTTQPTTNEQQYSI